MSSDFPHKHEIFRPNTELSRKIFRQRGELFIFRFEVDDTPARLFVLVLHTRCLIECSSPWLNQSSNLGKEFIHVPSRLL